MMSNNFPARETAALLSRRHGKEVVAFRERVVNSVLKEEEDHWKFLECSTKTTTTIFFVKYKKQRFLQASPLRRDQIQEKRGVQIPNPAPDSPHATPGGLVLRGGKTKQARETLWLLAST